MTSGDSDRLLPEQRARVRIDAMLEAAGVGAGLQGGESWSMMGTTMNG